MSSQPIDSKQYPPASSGAHYPVSQQQVPQGGAYYQTGGQPPAYAGYPNQQPAPTVIVQSGPPVQSFVCHIILSCFTLWCCGCFFGLIAFILAVVANNNARQDPSAARQYGRASIGVSIAGIVISVIVIIVSIVYYVLVFNQAVNEISEHIQKNCKYYVKDTCYASRTLSTSSSTCSLGGYYSKDDGFCYYKSSV